MKTEDNLIHYTPNIVRSKVIVGLSYPFLLIGLILMFYGNLFIGFIMSFVCGLNITSNKGIYFDIPNQKYLQYQAYFTVKSGQWKKLDDYKYISILTSHKTSRVYGQSGASLSDSFVTHDIYILNETHLKRVLIDSYKEKELASEKANELVKLLNFEIVKYNPQVSEQTKNRRYR